MNYIKRYLLYARVIFFCRVNAVISFMRRLPGLHAVIGESAFRYYKMKRYLSVLGAVFDMVKLTFGALLQTYVMIRLIPGWILGREPLHAEYAAVFVLTQCIAASISSSALFKAEKEEYMFLFHFMADPVEYYRYKALRTSVWASIPLVFFLGWMTSNWLLALSLAALKCCFILGGNILYLSYYQKKGRLIPVFFRRGFSAFFFLLCYALLYFGYIPDITIPPVFSLSVLTAALILCVVFWNAHNKYSCFQRLALRFKDAGSFVMTVSFASSGDSGKELIANTSPQENQKFWEKHKDTGMYEYMQKAFYARLGRGILKQYLINMALLLAIYLGAGILWRIGAISLDIHTIRGHSTLLIPLSLILSQSGRILQVFFYNVDFHLLSQGVYAALPVRRIALRRFINMLALDLLLGGFHFGCMLLFIWTAGQSVPFSDIAVFGAVGLLFLLIEDMYELIIYYYVQPYTRDVIIQSPVLKIVGLVWSMTGAPAGRARPEGLYQSACIPAVEAPK